jgi:hypothetical protein
MRKHLASKLQDLLKDGQYPGETLHAMILGMRRLK